MKMTRKRRLAFETAFADQHLRNQAHISSLPKKMQEAAHQQYSQQLDLWRKARGANDWMLFEFVYNPVFDTSEVSS